MEGSDKRFFPRKSVGSEARISFRPLDPQTWHSFWGRNDYSVNDLSEGGIGFYSPRQLPTSGKISIELKLNKDADPIHIFGKLIWLREENSGCKAGVKFSWWEKDQDRKTMHNYLESKAD